MLFWFWPTAAEAHVRWFVETADVTITSYSLAEPAVQFAILCMSLGLLTCRLLVPLEQRLWQKIKFPAQLIIIIRLIGIICIMVTAFMIHDWVELMPHVGFILFLLLIRTKPRLALTCLASSVGLNLIMMALDEKLLHPGLGVAFLQIYHWNFLLAFGFEWFSDRLFTLYAGSVELVLGLAMTLGLSPRLVMLLTLGVLFTTPFLLHVEEMLGHVMLIVNQLVFLVESSRIKA